jgi:isopenicillin-N epimerase
MSAGPLRSRWQLDPDIIFLNHGSYGACPTEVLQAQAELRARLEAEPVRFFVREFEPMLDAARAALASFLDADPDDLALVPNATAGVNSVLRSLRIAPGDELLTTNHEYNASRNALDWVAGRQGAKVVVAQLPWPDPTPQAVMQAVLEQVTPRTRLVLLDHISSQTAFILPLKALVQALRERGVETLVDGAHGPGQVPLSLRELGAAYYTGNCHKWLCAPKSVAFLHVRKDLQAGLKPLSISHGHNSTRRDRSRFQLDFDWTGTHDPTAGLCIPHALRVMGGMIPGGWPAVMADNHAKVLAARRLLCERLGVAPPCPEEMVGSMATVSLPDGYPTDPPPPYYLDPLQDRLFHEWKIEVPIIAWPKAPRRHLRLSAQLYNTHAEYQRLAEALEALIR